MNIVYFMLPMALLLGFGFVTAFSYASRRGQFDDLETPAHRMLLNDETVDETDLTKKQTPKPSPQERES